MKTLDIISKLSSSKRKMDSTLEKAKKSIIKKVEFEFEILFQSEDGWVLLNTEAFEAPLAPLGDCLSIIEMKGSLSIEDHKERSI